MDAARRQGQDATHILKHNTKINVYDLAGDLVDHDVGHVPVADTEYMSHDGRDGHAAGIVQTHGEPAHRILVLLREEMTHDRLEPFRLLEPPSQHVGMLPVLLLDFMDVLPELVGVDIEALSIPERTISIVLSSLRGYSPRHMPLTVCVPA
jgi:hypothetical protein